MITLKDDKGFKSSPRTASSETRLNSKASSIAGSPLLSGIDWLTGKFKGLSEQDADLLLEFIRGKTPISRSNVKSANLPHDFYPSSFDSLMGHIHGGLRYVTVDNPKSPDHGRTLVDGWFSLTGKFWEAKDARDRWRLVRGLKYTYNVHVTRMDVYIDDPTNELMKHEDFRKAHEEGNVFGCSKRWECTTYDDKNKPVQTLYFGSRTSAKLYRFYNHSGRNRLELEMKRDVARKCFEHVASIDSDFEDPEKVLVEVASTCAAYVTGNIDFRTRVTGNSFEEREKDRTRCPRIGFWERILRSTGEGIRVTVDVIKHHSLDKSLKWIDRQVIGTLLVLMKAYEGIPNVSWVEVLRARFKRFIESDRWSSRHQLMLETFISERNEYDPMPA